MSRHPVLCLGAMLWDVIGHSDAPLLPGDDRPGRVRARPGGVALNVALALAREGLAPAMLSAIGADPAGAALERAARAAGVATGFLCRPAQGRTGSYVAIESPAGLVAAVADTGILDLAGAGLLGPLRDGRLGDRARPWQGVLVIDANLPEPLAGAIATDPCLARARLRLVCASPARAARLRPLLGRAGAVLHLNRAEAEALAGRRLADAAEAAQAMLALGAGRAIVTDGPRPAADAARGEALVAAAPPAVAARRVTGAGDRFLAAHLAAELAGLGRAEALARALAAAAAHVAASDERPADHAGLPGNQGKDHA